MIFRCIVVLYNINYKDSVSYMDLTQTMCFRRGKMEIVCVDNSVEDFGNDELLTLDHHCYINMYGNKGLPKAYNAAIEYISRNSTGSDDIIVLLDDDTHIEDDYFTKMGNASKSDYDIFLPIVLDDLGILSPSIMNRYRCRRCRTLEEINSKNICGINSGMAMKRHVFEDYRYNEAMFLDYVDHSFIRDMKRQERKILIVDTELHQNFSSITDSYEETIKRFAILKKDVRVFYSRSMLERLFYKYVILRRKAGIAVRFKKISVFWKC